MLKLASWLVYAMPSVFGLNVEANFLAASVARRSLTGYFVSHFSLIIILCLIVTIMRNVYAVKNINRYCFKRTKNLQRQESNMMNNSN